MPGAVSRSERRGLFLTVLLSLGAFVVPQPIDYARQVQPLLHRRCQGCHGQNKPEAGLSVLSLEKLLQGGQSGPAILPGRGRDSLLLHRVTGQIGPVMPLLGPALRDDEVALLREWIDQGAQGVDSATGPARAPHVRLRLTAPPVPDSLIHDHPVDRFVSSQMRRSGLEHPFKVAPDAVFARRAHLDLWGVPPSPSRLEEFLQDSRPDKRPLLIQSLLENRVHFTGHWMSFWNDLLRNDDEIRYHGERRSITPWLYRAVASNLPYDELVRQLLNPTGEDAPTGFLTGVNWRGTINASQTPAMQAAQNSAQVFLGVNLKCASCHDSFINGWKLADSYGLASLFSESPLELVRCNAPLGVTATPRFLFPEMGEVQPDLSAPQRKARAAQLFTTPSNGRFAITLVNRIWERLLGRGFVSDVDDASSVALHGEEQLLNWLASDFVQHGYDLDHLIRTIMTSKSYQLPISPSPQGEADAAFAGPFARRLTAEQFVDSLGAILGEWPTYRSDDSGTSRWGRNWRTKVSDLTRALGRPIRDQVFLRRNTEATTLQALQLQSGQELAYLLQRGARRLLGRLESPPVSLFDSLRVGIDRTPFEVNLSGVDTVWLLIVDEGTYDPSRTVAAWADVTFRGPSGDTPLRSLLRSDQAVVRPIQLLKKHRQTRTTSQGRVAETRIDRYRHPEGVVPPFPGMLELSIAGRDFGSMDGYVGVDTSSDNSAINPRVRFLVFAERPDHRRLTAVEGPPPFPFRAPDTSPTALVHYLYRYALSRAPSVRETRVALELLGGAGQPVDASNLEDLAWALAMSPEFQYIH